MKRAFLITFSVLLIAASIFGLFAGVAALKDIKNIQDYKTADSELAKESIATARDGLAQLMENEDAYLDGANTYINGVAQLAEGKKTLAAGEKQIAEGQALLDSKTEEYNEGKALIAELEGYMPMIESIADSAQKVRDTNKSIIGTERDKALGELRANVLNFLADSSAVSAISDLVGMDVGSVLASSPTDTSVCGNVVDMYYDGLAQLKQYEDGLKQLTEAKKTLANGKKQLASAEGQLAEGNATLCTFEEGEATVAEGITGAFEQMPATIRSKSLVQTAPSLKELVLKDNPDWDVYVRNSDGSIKTVRGNKHVSFDNCVLVCDNMEEYLSIQEGNVKAELYTRVGLTAALAITSVLGIIAGVFGLVAGITGKSKTGAVIGTVAAVLAVAANLVGMFTNYTDYVYQVRDELGEYSYSGDLQFAALVVLAVAAVIFTIVASAARKSAKKAEEAYAAETNEAVVADAAAAVAEAVGADEKLADLEAENAALREMVAKLAAEAATVKE